MFQGEIPSRLVLGLVTSRAYSGDYKKSPFNFKHFDCNFVALYVDGQSLSTKPLPAFVKKQTPKFCREYRSLWEARTALDGVPFSPQRTCRIFRLFGTKPRSLRRTLSKHTHRKRTLIPTPGGSSSSLGFRRLRTFLCLFPSTAISGKNHRGPLRLLFQASL